MYEGAYRVSPKDLTLYQAFDCYLEAFDGYLDAFDGYLEAFDGYLDGSGPISVQITVKGLV